MVTVLLFRVDASTKIGSGHIMRCLTLANQAKLRGWSSVFVMRGANHRLASRIKNDGHELYILKKPNSNDYQEKFIQTHADWLEVPQDIDAHETKELIVSINPACLVVDHYALDKTWHDIIQPACSNLVVIDDLADRKMNCRILLNQNFGTSSEDYLDKINDDCDLCIGPNYVLLRQEFFGWRSQSFERRKLAKLKTILVSMGGADLDNYTLKVLQKLEKSLNAQTCEFIIVIGSLYPHGIELKRFAKNSAIKITIFCDINNMAEIMAKSDICIGAAGTSSWERCYLGLPTLTFTIAENQKKIATSLHNKDVVVLTDLEKLRSDFDQMFKPDGKKALQKLINNSAKICDGYGVSRILDKMELLIAH